MEVRVPKKWLLNSKLWMSCKFTKNFKTINSIEGTLIRGSGRTRWHFTGVFFNYGIHADFSECGNFIGAMLLAGWFPAGLTHCGALQLRAGGVWGNKRVHSYKEHGITFTKLFWSWPRWLYRHDVSVWTLSYDLRAKPGSYILSPDTYNSQFS